MFEKIICYFKGHKFVDYAVSKFNTYDLVNRICKRCAKQEIIRRDTE